MDFDPTTAQTYDPTLINQLNNQQSQTVQQPPANSVNPADLPQANTQPAPQASSSSTNSTTFDPSTAVPHTLDTATVQQSTQTPAVSQQSGQSPTPAQQIPQQNDPVSGVMGNLAAFREPLTAGIADSAQATGALAANIMRGASNLIYGKMFQNPDTDKLVQQGIDDIGSSAQKDFDAAKNALVQPVGLEAQAMKDHPITAAGSYGTGYVGGLLSGGGIVNKAVAPITGALADSVPMLSSRPTLSGVLDSGVQNATLGAASDPQNPAQGAVVGGLAGAALQGASGFPAYKLQRAGQIVNDEMSARITAGVNPYSPEAMDAIQNSLANNGVKLQKLDIQNAMKNTVNEQLNAIRPDNYTPNQSPINYVSKLASTNFQNELETSRQLYAPINASQVPVETPNFNTALSNIPSRITDKLSMPELNTEPGQQPTLSNMLDYRHSLDGTIQQAQNLQQDGGLSFNDVGKLYNARQVLNKDLYSAADQQGLGDAIQNADGQYNQMIRPFQVYDKNTASLKAMDPDSMGNQAWQVINRQLQARFPNPGKIQQAASTLGTTGQQIVGWAKIENDFHQATVDGVFNPATFGARISKSQQSGLNDIIMTPEQRQVVQGLQKIGVANKIITPTPEAGSDQQSLLTKVTKNLLYNPLGVGLLKVVGSPSTTMSAVRDISRKLLIGTAVLGKVLNTQQNQQQAPVPQNAQQIPQVPQQIPQTLQTQPFQPRAIQPVQPQQSLSSGFLPPSLQNQQQNQ